MVKLDMRQRMSPLGVMPEGTKYQWLAMVQISILDDDRKRLMLPFPVTFLQPNELNL